MPTAAPPTPAPALDMSDVRPQVVHIPNKPQGLLSVDSLPALSDVPAPVEATPEPPKATTVDTRAYPDARKVAAEGLYQEIASRSSLAGVAREMQTLPKTRDDKTPIAVQEAQFLKAQEQALADAVIERLLAQGFRIYPDALHCRECRTPLVSEDLTEAADAAYNLRAELADFMRGFKELAKADARGVLSVCNTMLDTDDRAERKAALDALQAILRPVED